VPNARARAPNARARAHTGVSIKKTHRCSKDREGSVGRGRCGGAKGEGERRRVEG